MTAARCKRRARRSGKLRQVPPAAPEILTIGHSTRSFDELAALLREFGVETLVDVRTAPRSRRHPHFDKEALAERLPAEGVAYVHLPALGGLRHRPKGAGPSPNDGWTVEAFRHYADHARTPESARGLDALLSLAVERRVAMMCAEAVWWRCHRRIVTDYLLHRGARVRHILGPGQLDEAVLTPFARPAPDGTLVYPADPDQLDLFRS